MANSDYRLATLGDVTAIVKLVNSAYRGDSSRKGWTTEADLLSGQRIDAEMVTELLERPKSAILLLPASGPDVKACVHLEKLEEGEVYLGMLTVDPTVQGGGFGDRLLAGAENYVREHLQAQSVTMTVIKQRTELLAWYARRGYRPTGDVKPFPYGDTRFGVPKRDDLEFLVLQKRFQK